MNAFTQGKAATNRVHKAVACVVQGDALLCFRHPDGTCQIPKGTLEPGEEPAAAALRELAEESGIVHTGPVLPLGTLDRVMGGADGAPEHHVWHLFLLPAEGLPAAWRHDPVGSPEEEELVFEYFWHPLRAPAAGFPEAFARAIDRVRAALG